MARPVYLRRSAAYAVTAAGAAVALGVLHPGAGPATAAPAVSDPCAASSIAKTVGNVATNTGVYLDAHPDTNAAMTNILAQPAGPQSLTMLKTYFDGNPQAGKDLGSLQQPISILSTRCNLPISLPQLLGLLQSAQQGGGLPAGLPGSPATAQSVPGTGTPAPATAPTAAPSPLAAEAPAPAPSVTSTR